MGALSAFGPKTNVCVLRCQHPSSLRVARDVAPEVQNRIGSDAAKLFAAPVGKLVADNCMQVYGGAGYCREYPIERLLRDAKLLEIGGVTLESHQKNLTKDLTKLHLKGSAQTDYRR